MTGPGRAHRCHHAVRVPRSTLLRLQSSGVRPLPYPGHRSAAALTFDARVDSIHSLAELARHDVESGRGKHGFQQPPESAELLAKTRGMVLSAIRTPILFSAFNAVIKNRACLGRLGRLEVEYHVMQAKKATWAQYLSDPGERDSLLEVRHVAASTGNGPAWSRLAAGTPGQASRKSSRLASTPRQGRLPTAR